MIHELWFEAEWKPRPPLAVPPLPDTVTRAPQPFYGAIFDNSTHRGFYVLGFL